VRRRIGVTFQSPALDRRLTVFENLKHHGRLYGVFGPLLRQRIQAAAERLQVADRLHDRVESLSGGLQRRAEIAKCLLHEPQLLLLDEPTAGLDPGARRSLWDLLRELRRDLGMSILLATHLLDEAEFCDRLGILDRGRFAAWGTPDELRRGVGGDCVTIRSPQPELLRVAVEARFQVAVRMRGHELRIERPRGYELVREVCEAWPDLVESVTVGRPTLEDAFIQKTGHGLEEG
jgi:ABC-2 type transport system ATP-binding protein